MRTGMHGYVPPALTFFNWILSFRRFCRIRPLPFWCDGMNEAMAGACTRRAAILTLSSKNISIVKKERALTLYTNPKKSASTNVRTFAADGCFFFRDAFGAGLCSSSSHPL